MVILAVLNAITLILLLIHLTLNLKNENLPSLIIATVVTGTSNIVLLTINPVWNFFTLILLFLAFVISLSVLAFWNQIAHSSLVKPESMKYYREISRKLFHLVALIFYIPNEILYQVLLLTLEWIYKSANLVQGFNTIIEFPPSFFLSLIVLIVATVAIFVFLILEMIRIHLGTIDYPDLLIRQDERERLAAEFYTAVGVLAASITLNWNVTSAVITASLIGDMAASLAGQHFGGIKIRGDRSLIGTLAEGLTSFVCSLPFVGVIPAIFLSIFIVVSDIFITSIIHDNLLFPIVGVIAVYASFLVI